MRKPFFAYWYIVDIVIILSPSLVIECAEDQCYTQGCLQSPSQTIVHGLSVWVEKILSKTREY